MLKIEQLNDLSVVVFIFLFFGINFAKKLSIDEYENVGEFTQKSPCLPFRNSFNLAFYIKLSIPNVKPKIWFFFHLNFE